MIDSTILSFVLFLCAVYIIHFTYAYVIYPQICCTFWTANEEYLYTPTCLSSLAFSFFHAGPSFYLVYFPSAWRAFFNMCFSSCLFEMSISPLFLKDSFDEYRLIHRFFFFSQHFYYFLWWEMSHYTYLCSPLSLDAFRTFFFSISI